AVVKIFFGLCDLNLGSDRNDGKSQKRYSKKQKRRAEPSSFLLDAFCHLLVGFHRGHAPWKLNDAPQSPVERHLSYFAFMEIGEHYPSTSYHSARSES